MPRTDPAARALKLVTRLRAILIRLPALSDWGRRLTSMAYLETDLTVLIGLTRVESAEEVERTAGLVEAAARRARGHGSHNGRKKTVRREPARVG